jgi:hypothetical protein
MEHFNESPKKGLQFLVERGLLSSLSPTEVRLVLIKNMGV